MLDALLETRARRRHPVPVLARAARCCAWPVRCSRSWSPPGCPALPVGRLRIFADVVARILVSYTVMPPDQPIDDVAAALADICIDGLVRLTTPNGGAQPS